MLTFGSEGGLRTTGRQRDGELCIDLYSIHAVPRHRTPWNTVTMRQVLIENGKLEHIDTGL